jgi:histone acetyltransferase (RNA polymerase elongator complex component)
MNKGHTAAETIEQLRRMDEAGIRYNISFMNGLAGSGNGGRHALESARVFNETNPDSINVTNVPVLPESELYREILLDDYKPADELEKLEELKLFIETITITARINVGTISHAAPLIAEIPKEKQQVLARLQRMLGRIGGKQYYDKIAYA